MSFIIVGLSLLLWVFLFVAWGINYFKPKARKIRGVSIYGGWVDEVQDVHPALFWQ